MEDTAANHQRSHPVYIVLTFILLQFICSTTCLVLFDIDLLLYLLDIYLLAMIANEICQYKIDSVTRSKEKCDA